MFSKSDEGVDFDAYTAGGWLRAVRGRHILMRCLVMLFRYNDTSSITIPLPYINIDLQQHHNILPFAQSVPRFVPHL
jgi:hypothetical protein